MEVAAAEATMRLNASCATYRAAPIEPLLRLEFSAETPGPTDFAKIVKADVAVSLFRVQDPIALTAATTLVLRASQHLRVFPAQSPVEAARQSEEPRGSTAQGARRR
jgi:hypothetical protein